jgi:hypothetical protein
MFRKMELNKKLLNEDMELFNDPEDFRLPPRRIVHPSDKQKVVKIFYTTLLVMFVLLTAGLIAWGFHTK